MPYVTNVMALEKLIAGGAKVPESVKDVWAKEHVANVKEIQYVLHVVANLSVLNVVGILYAMYAMAILYVRHAMGTAIVLHAIMVTENVLTVPALVIHWNSLWKVFCNVLTAGIRI